MNIIEKNNTKIIVHTDNYEDELIDSIEDVVLDLFDTIHLMPDTHIGKSVYVKLKLPPKIIENCH